MAKEFTHQLPRKLFISMGQLSETFIRSMTSKYHLSIEKVGSFPIFPLIDAMKQEIDYLTAENKKYKAAFRVKNNEVDEEDLQVNLNLKKESLVSKVIQNQTKLLKLIPKKEAEQRVIMALSGVKELIENTLPIVSQKLINLTEPRDVEIILSKEWNRAVKVLEDASEMKPWELDGKSKMLRTRISDFMASSTISEAFEEDNGSDMETFDFGGFYEDDE